MGGFQHALRGENNILNSVLVSVFSDIPPHEADTRSDAIPHGGFIKSLQMSPLWKDPFRNPNVFLYLKVSFDERSVAYIELRSDTPLRRLGPFLHGQERLQRRLNSTSSFFRDLNHRVGGQSAAQDLVRALDNVLFHVIAYSLPVYRLPAVFQQEQCREEHQQSYA